MTMFKLNEEKLRAAFVASKEGNEPEGYGWVAPFDPISIDADGLHRIVDDCLERDIIEKDDPQAMIAIYPLSISEPEPLLSVNPGGGPMLLGGQAVHRVSEAQASTPEDHSVIALRALVEDANALYAEFELAKAGSVQPPARSGGGCDEGAAAEQPAQPPHSYAIVITVEASDPESAWESISNLLLDRSSENQQVTYIGAPWQGIPEMAEALSTVGLSLGIEWPSGSDPLLPQSVDLSPCD